MKTALWYGRILRWDALSILNAGSFTQALEEEAISVVCKLRNHPSLVLWSGNNEDDCALRWSLQPFNINPNQDVVSRKVLPAVIYEFDPTRPYLPSSPYYSQAVSEKRKC